MTPDAEEVRRVLRGDLTVANREHWLTQTEAGKVQAVLGARVGDDQVSPDKVQEVAAEARARAERAGYTLTDAELRSAQDQARLLSPSRMLDRLPESSYAVAERLHWSVIGEDREGLVGRRVTAPDGTVTYEGSPEVIERMKAAEAMAAQRLAHLSNLAIYPGGTSGVS